MNRVILMGRLTKDPEVRYTSSNISVARFSIAVNRPGKPQEGQPTADFFDIVAWRQTADFTGKYFKKGQQVLVEGNLRNSNWTDQQGQKHFRTEVHIDHAYFADSKKDSQEGGAYPSSSGPAREGSYGGGQGGSGGGSAPRQQAAAEGGGSRSSSGNPNSPEDGDGFYQLDDGDEGLPF